MIQKVSEIRKAFLEYFKSLQHTEVSSSSLLPIGDPTLLFTTAGMVQFKPLYTGKVDLPYTRATSCQKCLRTTDLEQVGKTERHCTFFEMLGNFSFGDYFKKEAIKFAYDFSKDHLGFAEKDIWISVYEDDEESIELWRELGTPQSKIVRLGKEDNFWGPAGDTGACGPCSELYLDRGVQKGGENCGKKESCKPGCDCDRFLEFWNLVFNQYDQDSSGKLNPLKQTGIDTGMGLERVAMLLQNVDSVYDTDELKRIIQFIENLSNQKYTNETAPSFRVLTDHARAVAFTISDGIHPDRTGRGYVIRRLIRRASLFARKLNIYESFLYKIIDEIVDIYGETYPQLIEKQKQIISIVQSEEDLFLTTLENGLEQLETITKEYMEKGNKVLSGEDSFRLYSTFGFPPEMTAEILEEKGLVFDKVVFESELEKDRELSRESWKGKKVSFLSYIDDSQIQSTEFLGYEKLETETKILTLIDNEKEVKELKENMDGILVLESTPFYAESGGQIGDSGSITIGNSIFEVYDTQKENDIYFHIGKVTRGLFKQEDKVFCKVDSDRRILLTYHHSGTHLLNGALRNILGEHVSQKASLVSNNYLRFDFSHPNPLDETQITKVEDWVNHSIEKSANVTTQVMPLEEAKKTGAVAAFDEKYGDMVRIIKMENFSVEFCGGCHVKNTNDIRLFSIIKESSPGAGNRRIEAVCGEKVIDYYIEQFENYTKQIQEFNEKIRNENETLHELIINIDLVPSQEKIKSNFDNQGTKALKEYRELKKEIDSLLSHKNSQFIKKKKQLEKESVVNLTESLDIFERNSIEANGITIYKHIFPEKTKVNSLKELADRLKNQGKSVLVLFAVKEEDKIILLYMANKIAVQNHINCNELLRESCELLGGKGGGKAEMAQGGGKKTEKLEEALQNTIEKFKK